MRAFERLKKKNKYKCHVSKVSSVRSLDSMARVGASKKCNAIESLGRAKMAECGHRPAVDPATLAPRCLWDLIMLMYAPIYTYYTY